MKILVFIAILASPLIAQDWPHYLGPNQNGSTTGKISTDFKSAPPKTLWKAKVGRGCSSWAIVGNRALTVGNSDNQDTLWCFHATTGKVLWKDTYPEKLAPKYYTGGPGASPTVDGDRVYALSKSGRLACYSLADGKLRWKKNYRKDFKGNKPTWGFSASPVIYKNSLLCLPCTKGAPLVALDKLTGKKLWSSTDTARPGYSAPVLIKYKGRDTALVFHGRKLVAYDLEDPKQKGKVLFTHKWRTSYDVNASNPQFHDNKVWIASGYGMGYAVLDVSGSTPKILHRDRDLRMIFQNAILQNGDILGTFGDKNLDAELFRMNMASGKIAWRQKIPGSRASTVKVGNDTLAILSETGHLILGTFNKKNFTETARHKILPKLCWSPLAIAHGKLYARSNTGDAICLDLSR